MDLVADPCDEISSPHASDTYEHRSCFFERESGHHHKRSENLF